VAGPARRGSTATTIEALADWVLGFDGTAVPTHVLELAKVSLLDALGNAFAATTYSAAAAEALTLLDELGGPAQCTVIGEARRASVAGAAFANGVLIRALDCNDYLPRDPNDFARMGNAAPKLGSHPSTSMAIGLAVAERKGRSGRDFLTTMVMGYELNGRIQKLRGIASPWDHTTATALVTPAIAGRLLDLDRTRMAYALAHGMAYGITPGSIREGVISSSKFLADPMVAITGVMGALLAERGVSGPISLFEGKRGVGNSIFPGVDVALLSRPLEKFYIFEGVCIKAYPGVTSSQAAISAAIEVGRSFGGAPEDIVRAEVSMADVPAVTVQLADEARRNPSNQETADHSFHFLIALALVDGQVSFRQFQKERWNDPQVKSVMDRIVIRTDPAWQRREHGGAPAAIKLVARDGREFSSEVAYPLGDTKNPFGYDGIAKKFRASVDGIVAPRRAEEIVDVVATLDQRSVRDLMSLLGRG
jgi:2-methylcitrate dehydratase